MALMIPHDIDEFHTEGEGRFYKFLESIAKPDDNYVAWYLPDINGREPDFLLYANNVGLIIFEVKDWSLDQIIEANPYTFVLRAGAKAVQDLLEAQFKTVSSRFCDRDAGYNLHDRDQEGRRYRNTGRSGENPGCPFIL